MKRILIMALFMASGCASGPQLQQAIVLHNVTKHVVQAADEAFTPVYARAEAVADAKFPSDTVAYNKEMAELNDTLNALVAAKLIEQALHLAIEQWQSALDDGGMTREVAECADQELMVLGQKLAAVPGGTYLYAATTVLAGQLALLASGASCTVSAASLTPQPTAATGASK
jgi:hypothetical protein